MNTPLPDGWKEYCCTYRYDGKEWGFEIPARSEREARERLAAMSLGRVDGELAMSIPYFPTAGLITRAIVFLRNWWVRVF